MRKAVAPTRWMRIREVADRLGVSRPTALSLVQSKKVPGGELMYRTPNGANHYRVERAVFEEWLASRPTADDEVRLPLTPIVYFVQPRDRPDAPVKIGTSTLRNMRMRLMSLEFASPYKLAILATMPGDHRVERGLHKRFRDCRLHGEWFTMTPELRQYINEVEAAKSAA